MGVVAVAVVVSLVVEHLSDINLQSTKYGKYGLFYWICWKHVKGSKKNHIHTLTATKSHNFRKMHTHVGTCIEVFIYYKCQCWTGLDCCDKDVKYTGRYISDLCHNNPTQFSTDIYSIRILQHDDVTDFVIQIRWIWMWICHVIAVCSIKLSYKYVEKKSHTTSFCVTLAHYYLLYSPSQSSQK